MSSTTPTPTDTPQVVYQIVGQYEIPSESTKRKDGMSCWTCGLSCCGLYFLVMCGIPLLCFGVFAAAISATEGNDVTLSDSQTLTIRDPENVTVEISGVQGTIQVLTDPNEFEKIRVDIVKRGRGFSKEDARDTLDNIEVVVERQGDVYVVRTEYEANPFDSVINNVQIDLTVYIPKDTVINLTINGNFGATDVQGVTIRDSLVIDQSFGEVYFEGVLNNPNGVYEINAEFGSVLIEVGRNSQFRYEGAANFGDAQETLSDDNNYPDDSASQGPETRFSGVYGDKDTKATLTVEVDFGAVLLRNY